MTSAFKAATPEVKPTTLDTLLPTNLLIKKIQADQAKNNAVGDANRDVLEGSAALADQGVPGSQLSLVPREKRPMLPRTGIDFVHPDGLLNSGGAMDLMRSADQFQNQPVFTDIQGTPGTDAWWNAGPRFGLRYTSPLPGTVSAFCKGGIMHDVLRNCAIVSVPKSGNFIGVDGVYGAIGVGEDDPLAAARDPWVYRQIDGDVKNAGVAGGAALRNAASLIFEMPNCTFIGEFIGFGNATSTSKTFDAVIPPGPLSSFRHYLVGLGKDFSAFVIPEGYNKWDPAFSFDRVKSRTSGATGSILREMSNSANISGWEKADACLALMDSEGVVRCFRVDILPFGVQTPAAEIQIAPDRYMENLDKMVQIKVGYSRTGGL